MPPSSRIITATSVIGLTGLLGALTVPSLFRSKDSNSTTALNSGVKDPSPSDSILFKESEITEDSEIALDSETLPALPTEPQARWAKIINSNLDLAKVIPEKLLNFFGPLDSWIPVSDGAISIVKANDQETVIIQARVVENESGRPHVLISISKVDTESDTSQILLKLLASDPETFGKVWDENKKAFLKEVTLIKQFWTRSSD